VKICIATYQSVNLLKGGPRTQILQTKRGLEDLGAKVSLFDSWKDFRPGEADIIHIFGSNIGTYHLAREIQKISIPMVVTPIWYSMHSSLFIKAAAAFDMAARKVVRGFWTDYGMLAEICGWARAVLPNTKSEAALLERGLGIKGEKIFVIPNGVEERFYNGDPALFVNRYGIRDFILNVGHIGPGRKNVLRLISALEKVNTPAVIIGRIEDNAYGRACLAAAKKRSNIFVLDAIPNESPLLASAYAACDVFALPSLFETPGVAALEAALAGAKIVITKNGGTEEYFGATAEYVDPTSTELIRHGIITALNKEKTSALRDHVKEEFLWEKVAAKTMEVYGKVLA